MTTSFLVFDTSVGACGIAWHDEVIVGVQLPEADERATRRRLLRRHPGAVPSDPPAPVRRVVDDIVRLLQGEPVDLSTAPLDMSGIGDFEQQVYREALTIPPGSTLTYGDVATRLGSLGLSRAVGQALGRNPFPIVVPCHRVLAAGGAMGGFSANGGVATKRRLLFIEGALAAEPLTLFE